MSDSVDRVFVHALATVRRLPRTGSSRPPPSARLRLYGLYKQSMEGDVLAILPRPTLPPSSPDPNPPPPATSSTGNNTNSSNNNGNAVHRYASRDLRTREAQAEIEKWDAWHACAGMSRTEAKRRYISTLIDTMKEYASGTQESRELVSELEFVWSQIRSQSGSSEDDDGSGGGQDRESPTRRLERAGLKNTISHGSSSSLPPGRSQSGSASVPAARQSSQLPKHSSDPNRLRVLSPVSARSIDEIVEGEETGDGVDEPSSPHPEDDSRALQPRCLSDPAWRASIDAQLHQLSTEIAALREQLSSNNLLSSSSYSPSSAMSRRRRLLLRMATWLQWFIWAAARQLLVDVAILVVALLVGRWRGDRRIEEWTRRRWKDLRRLWAVWGIGKGADWSWAWGWLTLPRLVR